MTQPEQLYGVHFPTTDDVVAMPSETAAYATAEYHNQTCGFAPDDPRSAKVIPWPDALGGAEGHAELLAEALDEAFDDACADATHETPWPVAW